MQKVNVKGLLGSKVQWMKRWRTSHYVRVNVVSNKEYFFLP